MVRFHAPSSVSALGSTKAPENVPILISITVIVRAMTRSLDWEFAGHEGYETSSVLVPAAFLVLTTGSTETASKTPC